MEFPLEICDENTIMSPRHKSTFQDAPMSVPSFKCMFTTSIDSNLSQCEVVVDFLKYLHIPPPPHTSTYAHFGYYLWNYIVLKRGFHRGVKSVTLAIDKPSFLPKIRSLVHSERAKAKISSQFLIPNSITTDDKLWHGSSYTALLQVAKFKTILVDFLSFYLLSKAEAELATSADSKLYLIIDFPTFGEFPKCVNMFSSALISARQNNKGEAGCGVW